MVLKTALLNFEINAQGNRAGFIINEKPESAAMDSDFWRLILDDGLRTEIPVCSHEQSGRVTQNGESLEIVYDKLLSSYGDVYDITLTVTVKVEDGLFKFTPALENRTKDTRINECFCPLADFTELCGDKATDALYWPNGLGTRVENPWEHMRSQTAAYYAHDDREIFMHLPYPRATMGWYGVQSGDRFLYVSRYDPECRLCFLTLRQTIHADPLNLLFGIDHFPMARPGESLTLPSSVIGLLDGDWRTAAKRYRAWADANFFTVREKADWVKHLTGWQRIILRSQYGEDYYTAEDLPRIYEAGAKYGIRTIFLFAWWKEGMDRNYPIYKEPYGGAFRALAENIKKVQDMGGRVILECNCHFMDPHIDYYKQFGEEVRMLDINGNEYRPAFVYSGRGEIRTQWGAVQFPLCCAGTKRWRDQLLSQFKQMADLGADCLFADCYGGCPSQPCFNDKHEHGNRIDEEWIYHRKFFTDAIDFCKKEDKVLGTEVVTDIAAAYAQFIHGLVNVDFKIKSNAFPALFRYTFPEVITTDRGIRAPEGDFAKQLRYALTTGVRLDAELYVCRAALDRDEAYAKEIGFYTEKLDRYGEFFYDGTFTVLDTSALPYYIKRGEFYSADKKRVMRVLYNASADAGAACGAELAPDEVRFDIFDTETYTANLAK
ncbi:MAG: hypothetical protein IJU41_02400 [Clostridia bacterium]|nr:hypothetical protein [Clostridia bacterium]